MTEEQKSSLEPESPFRQAVVQLSRVPAPQRGQQVDIQSLADAFALFNETTQNLEKAHRELERRVQQVDAELERKNRELAQANRDLQAKIAELDRMRSYLNNLIDSMGSGLICLDTEGQITTINRATREMTGWDDTQVLHQPWTLLLAEDSQRKLSAVMGQSCQKDHLELMLVRKSGERFPVRATTAPIQDENGQVQGQILTFIDQSGVRLLEEKVRRAGRLAALGELAAGVAHEMRNPLTTIRGFIQIFPEESDDPEFRKEFTVNALREIDRLTKLTNDLLNLAKPTTMNIKAADAKDLVEEVLAFLSERLEKAGVEVVWNPPEQQMVVSMDRDRIKQVLLNLMLNAMEAMSGGGRLEIGLFEQQERLRSSEKVEPFVVFKVRDNGPGIEKENLERLFDPFFTTKDNGTGLGLAVSYRIVEEHNGFLRVESEPGQGAEFSLLLPVQPEHAEEKK